MNTAAYRSSNVVADTTPQLTDTVEAVAFLAESNCPHCGQMNPVNGLRLRLSCSRCQLDFAVHPDLWGKTISSVGEELPRIGYGVRLSTSASLERETTRVLKSRFWRVKAACPRCASTGRPVRTADGVHCSACSVARTSPAPAWVAPGVLGTLDSIPVNDDTPPTATPFTLALWLRTDPRKEAPRYRSPRSRVARFDYLRRVSPALTRDAVLFAASGLVLLFCLRIQGGVHLELVASARIPVFVLAGIFLALTLRGLLRLRVAARYERARVLEIRLDDRARRTFGSSLVECVGRLGRWENGRVSVALSRADAPQDLVAPMVTLSLTEETHQQLGGVGGVVRSFYIPGRPNSEFAVATPSALE